MFKADAQQIPENYRLEKLMQISSPILRFSFKKLCVRDAPPASELIGLRHEVAQV